MATAAWARGAQVRGAVWLQAAVAQSVAAEPLGQVVVVLFVVVQAE